MISDSTRPASLIFPAWSLIRSTRHRCQSVIDTQVPNVVILKTTPMMTEAVEATVRDSGITFDLFRFWDSCMKRFRLRFCLTLMLE